MSDHQPMQTRNANLVVATFRNHAIFNEGKSKKAGRPVFDDMEICELRFAGNKQTVGVFPAHEVFKKHHDITTGAVTELTYAMQYSEQYKKFKAGEAQEQGGTPLSELPFLTQAKRLELKALNIHTAEALAAVDGPPLKLLGMGGRELKNQAKAYLDNAAGNADITAIAARLAALEEENASLKAKLEGLPAQSGNGSEQGAEPGGMSPFASWDDADIRNWIQEAGGKVPPGNAKHATLVKAADELNAQLAKQKAKEAAAA